MTWTQAILIALGVLCGSVGGVLLKIGSAKLAGHGDLAGLALAAATSATIWLAMALYFAPVLIWIYLLRHMQLTLLQPLLSLVYVVTPLLAAQFLGESVSLQRWAGILVIVVGVTIVAKS
jgi:drug/metabolite transporter (DMT)-like permease